MTLPASVTDELLAAITARVPSTAGGTHKLTEVYSGEVVVELPQSTPEDIEQAYAAARRAQMTWSQWPVRKRVKVFKRFFKLLVERNDTIADLIQVESGKARRMAVEETVDPMMIMNYYLPRVRKLLAPTKRSGPVPLVSTSTEIRQPKGVVGIIAPWNFPFATGISDAIPALLAGNGVVLKPDNKTALSPLYGVHLLYEAGLPEGLFQVVCGDGPVAGPPVIDNANYVMFTGSTQTGRFIGQRAGQNLIGACLELGGKNPMIVLPDANLDETVPGALDAVFRNTGQVCMHVERMYVHDSLYDAFRQRFVAAVEDLRLGAAYDFGPEMGSLISPDHKDRVAEHVADALAKGATLVTGGNARPDLGPAFFEPTVLEGVTKDMLAGCTETFGPVVALHRYHSVDEAVRLANDTDYGLSASVWGTDLTAAAKVGARIQSGNVSINEGFAAAYAAKGTPSGGVKQSGVGARHGDQGLLKYTDVQNLAVMKKQVMTSPRDPADFAKQRDGMLKAMTFQSKLGR
ncbi:succinic semialdehyde dehydrogenase [Nocardioides massiliensis]|uniref:Aldehyde dehydrogenase (NAD+)/succinate-semialdehyde dehydrogenase/glutarate-semialdehyde dehydrogenase n=1 Tax=Nocardioides massiliensis TaxID=1325935 RepID=A0ABT9NP88_9ACTN|nr:succinic semialdehyde dehydrogenase [Nocardioides massiliensis]MDP9822092.1 aldehyde dehydrogenase (NAD+)/succinate-semialdehyde dehydrogenase/glutarate-semialdehyde dehydrogenase [Nocardioides massiliensis]